MTTQPADDYDDPAPGVPDDQLTDDELAQRRAVRDRNRAGFEHRRESKEAKQLREENEALRRENETFKREKALAAAVADLQAEGPLRAFLSRYDGDPTPDAIRKAVADDPDWRDVVKIAPDPRDVAAAEQIKTAEHMAGATAPSLGAITPVEAAGWDVAAKTAFMHEHPDLWNDLLAGKTVAPPVT